MKTRILQNELSFITESPFDVLALKQFEGKTPVVYLETWATTEDGLTNGILKIKFLPNKQMVKR